MGGRNQLTPGNVYSGALIEVLVREGSIIPTYSPQFVPGTTVLTAQALVEAFSADVVEALKSEVVPFLVHSASANSEMGKNEAEAQPQCRQRLAHPGSHPSLGWGSWRIMIRWAALEGEEGRGAHAEVS